MPNSPPHEPYLTGSTTLSKWAPSIYFLVGQAGWFVCVLSAARGAAWVGVSFASLSVAVHLLRVPRPLEEMKFVASVVAIGGLWESALVGFDLLAYPSGGAIAPLWIMALWALFAAQFNTTYRWLKPHRITAAVLGAVAGPLSFRAGAALGAVRFVDPWLTTAILAMGWAALLSLLIVLSSRWNGVEPRGDRAS